ncbi:MAG: delta 1-pyrroline-5-carboxylate synthetase [Candidatus Geothermarchaeales archaeon]
MEAVVKFGGSLAEDKAGLKSLCMELGRLAKSHRILVVPGGGRLSDAVREFDRMHGLSSAVSHKMAILSMDQYGLFLSDVTPGARPVYTLERAEELAEAGELPVLLPSRLMFEVEALEHSWDVTSDSIAAYIAGLIRAEKLVLVTDVDGIFTDDPKKVSKAELMGEISVGALLRLGRRTSVDPFLPKLLMEIDVDCYVVNGRHLRRIGAILRGEKTISTRIVR